MAQRLPLRAWALVLIAALLAPIVSGQDAITAPTSQLADLSLEELMNISVTSVSKKETKLNEAPAAITVITQDEIGRFGFTSLPEALRMVPGLAVARAGSNQWAISSRGFNYQYSNKLLVLMDGRSVYTPAFGGVYWNAQDMLLEDLDRIEVIRGPGGTLWGANAVNGVINITSKNSKDTQGTLVSTSAGYEDLPALAIRYGGKLAPNLHYRVYVKSFARDGLVDPQGNEAPGDWDSTRGGFRLDWEPSTADLVTVQGDLYSLNTTESVDVPSLTQPFSRTVKAVQFSRGGNALARWVRRFSDTSHLSLQAYFDYFREQQLLTVESRQTADVQLEHRFPLAGWNDLIWGLGYRFSTDEFNRTPIVSWSPASRDLHLFTAFLQDEISLVPDRLRFTIGSKIEHNDFTGFELQPSARLLWTPTARQSVWASTSRAVSPPARFQTNGRLNTTPFQTSPTSPVVQPALIGNANLDSEQVLAYELGYRVEATRNLSFDMAAFYNFYDGIQAPIAGAPARFEAQPSPHVVLPFKWENALSAEGYGTEVSVQWKPIERWRLVGSYSWLQTHVNPGESFEKASPEHQLSLRSTITLPWNLEFNTATYFVDKVEAIAVEGTAAIPAYLRVDAGIVWRPTPALEVGVWGQNLFDDQHPEFSAINTQARTEIPRGAVGKITWRF